jgi:outer membrane receptor protein involved in Fe transport
MINKPLLLGCCLAGCAGAGWAQENVSGALEEIVVTATKRESTVHDTPISLTAVTGENIQERGLADFTALAQSIPGLAMKSAGPGQTEFEMRGLASAGGNSAVVGFYLDDTPLSAPGGQFSGRVVIDPNLYDLGRVEVLRGPQGTLYGASSMGGTVKVITNPPSPAAFDASAQVTLSDTDGGGFNRAANAMLNLPMGSTAALRLVVSRAHDSGWLDRIVIANGDFPQETNGVTTRGDVLAAPVGARYTNVNDEDLSGARAAILWTPTERLEIKPAFFYQRIEQGGLNQIDTVPGTNAHYQPFDFPEGLVDRIDVGSINVRYRFDDFELVSTTARWTREEDTHEDGTEEVQWALSSPAAILPFYISQGGFGPISPDVERDRTDQWSEELRLTSTGDTRFKWLVGYFYSDLDSSTDLSVIWPGAAGALGTANAFTQIQPIKILQNSAFANLSYQITPRLSANLGARRYSFTSSLANYVSGALSSTGGDTVGFTSSTERDQGLNPQAGLSYAPNRDLLLYATAARGFRPGGGNQVIPTSPPLNCEPSLQMAYHTSAFVPAPLTFKPDNVWSYEVGEKSEWLDHRLSVNAAQYFERWNGVQQNVALLCGFPFTANAGDAHIYGTEVEINSALTTELMLQANVGFTHGAFVAGSFGGLDIASGTQLQNIPKWTSSQSLVYRHPLARGLTLIARFDNDYVGSRIDLTYGVNHLPSYDLAKVRFGVTGAQWSVALFASNLTNTRALIDDVLQYNIDAPTFNRGTVSQPLTVGLDVAYRYR